jgi:hypothetical protein
MVRGQTPARLPLRSLSTAAQTSAYIERAGTAAAGTTSVARIQDDDLRRDRARRYRVRNCGGLAIGRRVRGKLKH